MFSHIFLHIRTHLGRSLGIVALSGIVLFLLFLLVFLYQNIISALTYYSYSGVDARRFSLTASANVFTMFGEGAKGIDTNVRSALMSDPHVSNVESYSLVDIPVLVRFSLFRFGLDIDMPIFAVGGDALTGATVPIGLPKAMFDFYNLQFAGSSELFPQMPESFLKGQKLELIFGKSKVFPSLPLSNPPITGTITRISSDYPGFGVMVPESIVESELARLGYAVDTPYRIVGYMRDPSDQAHIMNQYGEYHPRFDTEKLREKTKRIDMIRLVFFGVGGFFVIVFGLFLFLLFTGYFRERRDVFRMITVFALSGVRARMMTLAEPICLILIGVGVTMSLILILQGMLPRLAQYLVSEGVLAPLISLDMMFFFIFTIMYLFSLVGLVVLMEWQWRRKKIFR